MPQQNTEPIPDTTGLEGTIEEAPEAVRAVSVTEMPHEDVEGEAAPDDTHTAARDESLDDIDIPGTEDVEDDDEEAVAQDVIELGGVLEALIFASDEPLTFRQIKDVLAPDEEEAEAESPDDAPSRGGRKRKRAFTITRVKNVIDALNAEYEQQARSFRIIEVSGGFAFQTIADYGVQVGKLFAERSRRRLTQSALETLAIIAFRQPISKPAIEAIRGVNAEHVVKSLLERNLISIVGRDDSVGRPLLYGTTKTFLKHFGLRSLNDLPKPREIQDLLKEDEDFASNSIEELDPEELKKLTGASSLDLERLFESARQSRAGEDSEPAVLGGDQPDDAEPQFSGSMRVQFDTDVSPDTHDEDAAHGPGGSEPDQNSTEIQSEADDSDWSADDGFSPEDGDPASVEADYSDDDNEFSGDDETDDSVEDENYYFDDDEPAEDEAYDETDDDTQSA